MRSHSTRVPVAPLFYGITLLPAQVKVMGTEVLTLSQ